MVESRGWLRIEPCCMMMYCDICYDLREWESVMNNETSITELELMSSQREVETLHAFFAAWYNGELENGEGEFARFAEVMGEGFHMITPRGDVFDRVQVLGFVREGWRQFDAGDEFAIEIRNFRVMERLSDEVIVVLYEEWQTEVGFVDEEGRVRSRGRLSAAGLARDESMVNGWRWLFVHEVWLPE